MTPFVAPCDINPDANYSTDKKLSKLTSYTRLAHIHSRKRSQITPDNILYSFNTFSCEDFYEEHVNDRNRVTANLNMVEA